MLTEEQVSWERKTIKELLDSGMKERRLARRWGIFFKLTFMAYIIVVSYFSMEFSSNWKHFAKSKPFVAVVNLAGPIMNDSAASADDLKPLIEDAFENKFSQAVILKINSPGGTPVQANKIFTQLERLKKKYPEKKLYAVIEDVGASGAYWVACAADKIYADQASIVGSIGVLIETYGFVKAIEKIGVERRIYSAGENKVFLDPFLNVKPHQEKILANNLHDLHQMFITVVKNSRGERLSVDHQAEIFSGEFWLGQKALTLGIIDGLGDVQYVAKDIIGVEEIVEYAVKPTLFSRFTAHTAQLVHKVLRSESGFLSILK